jgi:hypothetical protein
MNMVTGEKEKIENYIDRRRMVSVSNLRDYFNLSYCEINEVIVSLIEERKIRISGSRSPCGGKDCQSCHGSSEHDNKIESMIVISLGSINLNDE